MKLHHLIPRPLRRMLPHEFKFAVQRAREDANPSLSFALSPRRWREERADLDACRAIPEYLEFTRRRMGVGSVQQPREIEGVLAYLGEDKPKRVCEIGTEHGGTTLLLSRLLPTVELLIGVDLYIKHEPQLRAFKPRDQKMRLLRGSSHSPRMAGRVRRALSGANLDVLFIDGDHTYAGVKSDFLRYRHFVREGGLILFHDIVPDHGARGLEKTAAWTGGVPLLWERLKALYPYREFVQDAEQDGYGIGVLRYSRGVELPPEFLRSSDDLDAYPHLARVQTC